MPGKDSHAGREDSEMDTSMLDSGDMTAKRLFARPADVAGADLALERERRKRAEKVAADMARLVAAESRRAEDERTRRLEAENVAAGMATLVAHENARAKRAE